MYLSYSNTGVVSLVYVIIVIIVCPFYNHNKHAHTHTHTHTHTHAIKIAINIGLMWPTWRNHSGYAEEKGWSISIGGYQQNKELVESKVLKGTVNILRTTPLDEVSQERIGHAIQLNNSNNKDQNSENM